MKTPNDPRHRHRIKLMQSLFAWEFGKNGHSLSDSTAYEEENEAGEAEVNQPQESSNVPIQHIVNNIETIDGWLKQAAPTWPLDKINRIDLAILRLAIYELMIEKTAPPKVVIDEAVELGKSYGSDSSPSFINGALGKLTSESAD